MRRPLETLGDDIETAIGDLDDPDSIGAALAGVERVFLASARRPAEGGP